MSRIIRWGILGAGEVVDRWMRGAMQVENMEIVAIASRTRESARKRADKWNIPVSMTYDEMIADHNIDIVYIPVPHTAHKELAVKAMNGGKSVLVEKPAAINEQELKEMISCAKENHVFFMEAVWTRFFPIIRLTLEKIKNGDIGEVRSVESAFSFRVKDDNHSRLVDISQGGGGLLDTGVYNLHFAQMIYGKSPVKLLGLATMDSDELHLQVDEQAAYIGQYDHGELAVMSSGIRTQMLDTAYVYGTKGYMIIPQFWKPTILQTVTGNKTETVEEKIPQKFREFEDEGYQFEIQYVNECLISGCKESPLVSWDNSLQVIRQCDELRRQWGLKYPTE